LGWRALADIYVPNADDEGAADEKNVSVADANGDQAYVVRTDMPPPMVRAAKARVADDAEVIGIDGPFGPRAYVLSAMARINNHIINDSVAIERVAGESVAHEENEAREPVERQPLSLTYCPRTDCVRVFTRPDAQGLLYLRSAGLHYGEMHVLLDYQMYRHRDSAIPLDEVEFVRTDWKTWRRTRPDTLVFDGKQPKSERASPAPGSRQAS
jgi:hypothetical protein